MGYTKKTKFVYGPVSPNVCARCRAMMIVNLSSLKTSKTAAVLMAGVTILSTPCPINEPIVELTYSLHTSVCKNGTAKNPKIDKKNQALMG
jgi:polygalacturonase